MKNAKQATLLDHSLIQTREEQTDLVALPFPNLSRSYFLLQKKELKSPGRVILKRITLKCCETLSPKNNDATCAAVNSLRRFTFEAMILDQKVTPTIRLEMLFLRYL
jgi:hypothetical protein